MNQTAGWQPIATVPERIKYDGEPVLLYKPDEPRSGEEMCVAYWGSWPGESDGWIRVGGKPIAWVSMWTDEPVPHGIVTHWMPLPEPTL